MHTSSASKRHASNHTLETTRQQDAHHLPPRLGLPVDTQRQAASQQESRNEEAKQASSMVDAILRPTPSFCYAELGAAGGLLQFPTNWRRAVFVSQVLTLFGGGGIPCSCTLPPKGAHPQLAQQKLPFIEAHSSYETRPSQQWRLSREQQRVASHLDARHEAATRHAVSQQCTRKKAARAPFVHATLSQDTRETRR